MLARIRAANAAAAPAAPAGPIARPYRQRGELDQARLLGLLAGRLADYRAIVRRTTADRLGGGGDAAPGAATGRGVAIAETGTIVLDGSAGQGRRAITLVPDYHLCIVHARQVVAL